MLEMANIGRHRRMELDWGLLRTIGDRGATDPGGGVVGSRGRQPAWPLPVGRGLGLHWTSSEQAFPPLGSHSTTDRGRNERNLRDCTEGVLRSGDPMVPVSTVERDGGSLPVVPQVSGARGHGRGMRPAGRSRPIPQSKIKDLTDKRENAAVRPLSVEAEEFSLGTGTRNRVSDGGGDFLPPLQKVELYNAMLRYRPQPRLGQRP